MIRRISGTGSHQRMLVAGVCAGLIAEKLKVVVESTHGDPSARVYEVRVQSGTV